MCLRLFLFLRHVRSSERIPSQNRVACELSAWTRIVVSVSVPKHCSTLQPASRSTCARLMLRLAK